MIRGGDYIALTHNVLCTEYQLNYLLNPTAQLPAVIHFDVKNGNKQCTLGTQSS